MSKNKRPGPRGRGAPFGGRFAENTGSGVSDQLLKNARKTGQLNLSNRELQEVPQRVWRVNADAAAEAREASSFDTDERWWDQVDLTKLILASNKIQSISDEISLLSALSILDIHDNALTSLPASIGDLTQLHRLNLGHNKLTSLPDSLGNCQELSFLHLEHNLLKSLPACVCSLSKLEDMDLSHNDLEQLPTEMGQLQNLHTLNLSNNKLSSLPSQVQYLKGVRTLDLTYNKLTSLPDELGFMRSLQQLYVRHNCLKTLPMLTECSELKELHLGNNALQQLTAEHLRCLEMVSVLDVRDNKISSIPEEITLLLSLERLDISNNDVSGLPYELGNMTKLKSLVVDGNPMRSIRRDIIARGSEGIKSYLRSRIEQAPAEPSSQSAVRHAGTSNQTGLFGGGDQIDAHNVKSSKTIDYSGKKAEEVPTEVWELAASSQVTEILLSKNQLKSWPEQLRLLVDSVSHIHLGFNKLISVPADVGLFLQLTNLDLRNNQLTDLPSEMESCQSLHTLTLSFNRLPIIPDVIYKLKNLETLLLSDNQLSSIDAIKLHTLSKLASLDLQNNNISQIPPELGNCTSLRSLLLLGNPARNPRPAILNKGTVAILEYLRDRIVV